MVSYKNRGFLLRLRFAMAGSVHGFQAERSLRTQKIVLAGVLLFLVILRPEPLWWALAIICSTTVLAAELLNSALERLRLGSLRLRGRAGNADAQKVMLCVNADGPQ